MKMSPTQTNRVTLLFEAFIESAADDSVEARTVMQEAGLNPSEEVHKGLTLIHKLQGRAALVVAKQRTIDLQERAKTIRNKLRDTMVTITDPIAYLADLLSQRGKDSMQLQFRKLDNLSVDDALSMIDETELLTIFEDLEKGDSSETL